MNSEQLYGTETKVAEVYEVARWSEVFETSESRKCKTLTWISERTDFDSTFWQQGLDEFGPVEWPRVYGNWMILIRTAAKAKVRGRLSGDKGEPWTAARIARPSGCDAGGLQIAFDFAVKTGCLIRCDYSPGDSPGNLPERREKTVPTVRNGTEQNKTLRDGTEHDTKAAVPSRAVDLESESTGNAGREKQAAVTLVERSRSLQILEWLGRQIVKPGDASVFGMKRPSMVIDDTLRGPSLRPEYWLQWYCDQLPANGVLRGANMAEAAFVLATTISLRETPSGKMHKPKAWVKAIADRDTKYISDSQFVAAAIHCEKFFGVTIPPELFPKANERKRAHGPKYATAPAAAPADVYKPDKLKSEAALKRIRENKQSVPGVK